MSLCIWLFETCSTISGTTSRKSQKLFLEDWIGIHLKLNCDPFFLFHISFFLFSIWNNKYEITMYYWLDRWRIPHSKNTTTCSFYLNSVWISAVVRKPLPLRSRHLNKYVKPSGASLFSRASTKSRKLSKSISRALPPPIFPRRTCSSKTSN